MEDKKKLIDDIMESAEGDAKAEKICAEANRFYAERRRKWAMRKLCICLVTAITMIWD